jgi:hypothetical protein
MCNVDGCDATIYCRGLCRKHYDQTRSSKRKIDKRAYRAANKDRIKKMKADWNSANPTYAREYLLKCKYGITLEQYNEIFNRQNGKCAICKRDKSCSKYNTLNVDHNHITNKIRGLLCNNCNLGLGYFKDSKDLLNAAINYLINIGD